MANDTVDYSKFTADKIKAAEEAAQKIKDAPDLATAREHILSLPTQEMGGPQASLGAYTPNAAMDQQAKLQADKQAAYAAGQGMQPMIGTRPANANVQAIRQSPDVSNQMPSVSSGQTLPPSPPVAYTAPQPQFGANGLDNANQFDQQQLEQLNKQGKLSYQDYLKALPNAAPMPPLDTTPKKREDLRYGTDVHGNPIVPDASKISPNLPAPPLIPGAQTQNAGGPAITPVTNALRNMKLSAGKYILLPSHSDQIIYEV